MSRTPACDSSPDPITWHLTFRPSDSHEHNVLNQTIDNPEQYGTPVDDILKAGEISLHSDLPLHGSEANESDRRRCGLTLWYCGRRARALRLNEKGVVVSGHDPSGHWANAARRLRTTKPTSCAFRLRSLRTTTESSMTTMLRVGCLLSMCFHVLAVADPATPE
ncbi:MAG: hypothetical protein R3B90_11315 [Planctomycetaceae bacterium]